MKVRFVYFGKGLPEMVNKHYNILQSKMKMEKIIKEYQDQIFREKLPAPFTEDSIQKYLPNDNRIFPE